MLSSLLLSALLMGMAGGPHCLAMCGSACMGVSKWPGSSALRNVWLFQVGRVLGYATLGAVAAVSMNTIGWLAAETPVLHPVWSMLHIAALLWGLWLLWRAEQPLWLSATAQAIWTFVSSRRQPSARHSWAALWLGMVWALLPCGLLYSALLVAAFTAVPWRGALVMGMFALGGGLVLTVVPWLWARLTPPRTPLLSTVHLLTPKTDGALVRHWGQVPIANLTSITHVGTRVSGLLLAATAAWGLWTGLTHVTSPWCLPAWGL